MEETIMSVDFLMACALHPDTWFAWVPEDIIAHVPLDVRVSVSCTPDKVWISADQAHAVLWSSAPVSIELDRSISNEMTKAILQKCLYASLTPNTPEDPDPQAA